MLAIGDVLQNRYRVVRQLGHGGMGTVYEAHDERFEISVALKEVLIDLAKIADPAQQQMVARAFEREAKTLALLHHEAFPHVIDYFSERDHQYLIMELIRGEDLGEQLQKRKKPFEFDDVLNWTLQLLDALDYLHTQENPIIHRDLKPQNMKLTGRGKIKVLDFGIAKGADNKSSSTITNQTFVAATLNYSPIEQLLRVLDPTFREFISQRHKDKVEDILEHNADARSDLYSLGATLYQLLTATQPHDTLKRALDLWAGKPDPLPNPMELNPKIPPYYNSILLKSMEIDRDSRYVSAAEMQQAIKQYMENESRAQNHAAWMNSQQQSSQTPEIGMQTQIRIAEEQRFLAELDSSSPTSAQTEALPPLNQQPTAPPFIPTVNPEEERRRLAEQQKFLAELDAPPPPIGGGIPAPQSNAPLTDYGQIKPPLGQQSDQTNYAPQAKPSFDQTQVSYLDGVLPAQQAKAADSTVINPNIQNAPAVAQPLTPAATAVEPKTTNKMVWLIPVIGLGAILLVSVFGFIAYFALAPDTKTDTNKNTGGYTPPKIENTNKSSDTPSNNSSDTSTVSTDTNTESPADSSSSKADSKTEPVTPTQKSEPSDASRRNTETVKQQPEKPTKTTKTPEQRVEQQPRQPDPKPQTPKTPKGCTAEKKVMGEC